MFLMITVLTVQSLKGMVHSKMKFYRKYALISSKSFAIKY